MKPGPYDNRPFTLSVVDGRVTFTFDTAVFGWEGPVASSEDGPDQPTVCRIAFSNPDGSSSGESIAVTDDVEAQLAAFFAEQGLDWASNKAAIDAIRAQKTQVVAADAPASSDKAAAASSSASGASEPTTPTAVQVADLAPAGTNVGGTHVTVPIAHVGLIQEIVAEIKAGKRHFMDAIEALERVFGRAA